MGTLFVLAAGILWGTTGLAAHCAPAGSSPFAVGAGSMGLGGVLLYVLTLRPGIQRPSWHSMGWSLIAGTSSLVIYPLCFYGAMHNAGVALGTAVNIGSSPIMAMLIEWVTGRGCFTPRKIFAAGLAAFGLVLLTLGSSRGESPNMAFGVILALLAGLTYAGYTAAAHVMIGSGCPPSVAMGRIFGLAALVLVPFFIVNGGSLLTSPTGWAVMGYLALVPMGLAYVLFAVGLSSTPASTAVTLTLVEPVVASTLAVLVIGEHLALLGWGGLGLVLLGVLTLGLSDEETVRAEPGVTPLP